MKILSDFMVYAWKHGLTVELGSVLYQSCYSYDEMNRLPALRVTKKDKHFVETFRDIEQLELALKSGLGTKIAMDMCVEPFETGEI
jgi:hypothetical protein